LKILGKLKGFFKGKEVSPTVSTVKKSTVIKGEKGDRRTEPAADKSQGKSRNRPRRGRRGRGKRTWPEKTSTDQIKPSRAEAEPSRVRYGDSELTERGGRTAPKAERKGAKRRRAPSRDHRKRRKSDLGGTAQRIEFPELLPIDEKSEEFLENEFRPLGLPDKLVLILAANRFRTPTDIQQAMIPVALGGADILGQAKTGTGKTIAFLMPILERIDINSLSIQALVVVPTRELCRQVSWEARRFGRSLGARVLSLYGGTPVNREIERLKAGAQIVVGTPGRLLDHIFNKKMDLSQLKILVLDEADRMFDIGFRQDVIKIIKACPAERQIMLLSATLDKEVEDLSHHYMKDPVPLYLSRDEITVESIWQRYISVENREKMGKLVHLLETQKPTQTIIFTNTKKMSDSLALRLSKLGFKARCIHSDLSQNKRERIIDAFRTGKIEHLVATDVAARGLDITGISHVINYDIPENPEDYVHRVGRTGRMGAAGKAFTFVNSNEGRQLTGVEKLINKIIEEWDGS